MKKIGILWAVLAVGAVSCSKEKRTGKTEYGEKRLTAVYELQPDGSRLVHEEYAYGADGRLSSYAWSDWAERPASGLEKYGMAYGGFVYAPDQVTYTIEDYDLGSDVPDRKAAAVMRLDAQGRVVSEEIAGTFNNYRKTYTYNADGYLSGVRMEGLSGEDPESYEYAYAGDALVTIVIPISARRAGRSFLRRITAAAWWKTGAVSSIPIWTMKVFPGFTGLWA